MSEGTEKLELPEWVDEDIFVAFLTSLHDSLDEVEANTLALTTGDDGGDEALDAIKRVVHTLKGEAYVVGLERLGDGCHDLETHLEAQANPADGEDGLLRFVDWARQGLARLKDRQRPAPLPEQFFGVDYDDDPPEEGVVPLQPLLAEVQTLHASPSAEDDGAMEADDFGAATSAVAEANASEDDDDDDDGDDGDDGDEEAAPKRLAPPDTGPDYVQFAPFGPDMQEIVWEFVTESEESLMNAREVLQRGENEGCVPHDDVNALFRVFHTIKGVAGFIDVGEIRDLAHVTESVLIPCRDKGVPLSGELLTLISDATYAMADMTEDVRGILSGATQTLRVFGGVLKRLNTKLTEMENLDALEAEAALSEAQAEVTSSTPAPSASSDTVEAGPVPTNDADKSAASESSAAESSASESSAASTSTVAEAPPAVESKAKDEANAPAQSLPTSKAETAPMKSNGAGFGNGAKPLKKQQLRETVKVDLARVDSLVEMIGELVIIQSMLAHDTEIIDGLSRDGHRRMDQLAKISRDLQDMGMNMRMVPVRGVFQKMERMIRELGRKSGKAVRVVQVGANTEIDRSMVERLGDPLVHMIRNAMDHGIETPDERADTGKEKVATLELSAFHQGNRIVIELRDDGRGLNREKIFAKALSKGIVREEEVLSDHEVFNLIFHAGFSTADQVTELSGRGVGMDVVKKNIESMRGRVVVESEPGQGTCFQLVLPLTLAIIDGMIVRVGSERFIIPTLAIVESVRPTQDDIRTLSGDIELLSLRDELIQLVHLADLLDIDGAARRPCDGLVVVVEAGNRKIGIIIDDVLTQQQVVIKSLGRDFSTAAHLAGAAILSDGRVGLILSPEGLLELQDGESTPTAAHDVLSSTPAEMSAAL